ncbi:hypothetical protein GALMADRAFT_143155 [Galerina marginata CBS 339.88]|uniref:Uncharacterized protein n=1 Tax=Galerina marginata (strain CBS 339.88) TaxID=685588 RepID=A0A067SQI6_GALM3|nr:hypothetical protein GALMADRAFT_143155 [Galerina marginata CBS 339.88]
MVTVYDQPKASPHEIEDGVGLETNSTIDQERRRELAREFLSPFLQASTFSISFRLEELKRTPDSKKRIYRRSHVGFLSANDPRRNSDFGLDNWSFGWNAPDGLMSFGFEFDFEFEVTNGKAELEMTRSRLLEGIGFSSRFRARRKEEHFGNDKQFQNHFGFGHHTPCNPDSFGSASTSLSSSKPLPSHHVVIPPSVFNPGTTS